MEFAAGLSGLFGSVMCLLVGVRWRDNIWHRRREWGNRLLLVATALLAISAWLLAADALDNAGVLPRLLEGKVFDLRR